METDYEAVLPAAPAGVSGQLISLLSFAPSDPGSEPAAGGGHLRSAPDDAALISSDTAPPGLSSAPDFAPHPGSMLL